MSLDSSSGFTNGFKQVYSTLRSENPTSVRIVLTSGSVKDLTLALSRLLYISLKREKYDLEVKLGKCSIATAEGFSTPWICLSARYLSSYCFRCSHCTEH